MPASAPPKRIEPEEILDTILLTLVDGIGSLLFQRLLEHFQTTAAILDASRDELMQVNGIGVKLAGQILSAREQYDPAAVVRQCRQEGIEIIALEDGRYPESLKEIYDPPPLIYVRGNLEPIDHLAIAVVGTRGMSYYGRKQATQMVTGLVNAGFTIVSGLARGIDGAAHEAALQANGRTLAALGSGLLNIFPQEHLDLSRRIAEHGALISEFPPYALPLRGNFPRRNRIVSGLSLGTLVVESPRRGGALITARLAAEQNREVFAIPGPIDQENSRGCHQLLKEGAVLVENADDIIQCLGPLVQPLSHPKTPAPVVQPAELLLNEREKKLLQLIEQTPKSIDVLVQETQWLPHQVLGLISTLEFRKIIRRLEGNRVCRY